MQALSIDQYLQDDSWALARIIRRRAPWSVRRVRYPVSTYFRSERDGTGVDIYLIDSGLDTAHTEIAGRATNVYEVVSSGGAGDDYGHGTAVASCAAGETVGIARGAELFSFKVYNSIGTTTNSAISTAATQVLSHYNERSALNRPAVVCMAIGTTSDSISSGVAALIDAGMVVLAAVHNHGLQLGVGINMYPAQTADVIAVGGVGMADIPYYLGNAQDEAGTIQVGTNFGAAVDILAPAQGLRMAKAAVLGGGYRKWSGNSFSVAYATGVVACMLQGHDRLTSRTQVQAVAAQLLANATTGKLQSAFGLSPLPDKILYLDPDLAAPETISGL